MSVCSSMPSHTHTHKCWHRVPLCISLVCPMCSRSAFSSQRSPLSLAAQSCSCVADTSPRASSAQTLALVLNGRRRINYLSSLSSGLSLSPFSFFRFLFFFVGVPLVNRISVLSFARHLLSSVFSFFFSHTAPPPRDSNSTGTTVISRFLRVSLSLSHSLSIVVALSLSFPDCVYPATGPSDASDGAAFCSIRLHWLQPLLPCRSCCSLGGCCNTWKTAAVVLSLSLSHSLPTSLLQADLAVAAASSSSLAHTAAQHRRSD